MCNYVYARSLADFLVHVAVRHISRRNDVMMNWQIQTLMTYYQTLQHLCQQGICFDSQIHMAE